MKLILTNVNKIQSVLQDNTKKSSMRTMDKKNRKDRKDIRKDPKVLIFN